MSIKNITIFSAGSFGIEKILRIALSGFGVKVFEINQEALQSTRDNLRSVTMRYIAEGIIDEELIRNAAGRLSYTIHLSEAVLNSDLVIEAIQDNEPIRKSFYQQLGRVAPGKTIFASASNASISTEILGISGRADRFVRFQFAKDGEDWSTTRVTGHPGIHFSTLERATAFANVLDNHALPL